MQHRPRRSILYMPASNPRAIEKARSLPCDAIVLDLEDSVAPEAKADARHLARTAIDAGGFGARELLVRVNAAGSEWLADDLAMLRGARVDGVLVPKVERPADVAAFADRLDPAPALWIMVETCAAVLGIAALAQAPRLAGLVLGLNDLASEMHAPLGPDRSAFHMAMAATVMAARANGLVAVDGVSNVIDDAGALAAECGEAVRFGFDGKTLIHPAQIAVVNTAFTPDPAALASARAVIDAFARPENADRGAIRVDGRMVERLHLAQAERLVAIADAISARAAQSPSSPDRA